MTAPHGTVIAIGGREDKEGSKRILSEVASRIGNHRLVITAVASEEPKDLLNEYKRLFISVGVRDVAILDIHSRSEASDEHKVSVLDGARGIFFTGGDQLRITSQIGDTLIYHRIWDIYESGGVIAGTSAGASVMCATMLVAGRGSESPKAGGIKMAPGLGLIDNAIIDQHFAERGRMGRLLCAIAENPRTLGIGIDEDTAIVVENKSSFSVIGRGAVYVFDGTTLSFTNIAEEAPNETLSLHDVKLHVLSEGDVYDLIRRDPVRTTDAATIALTTNGKDPGGAKKSKLKVTKKSKTSSKGAAVPKKEKAGSKGESRTG